MRQTHSKEREREQKMKKQNLVESFIKGHAEPKLLNQLNELDEIVLPRQTLYLIDKVVRDRMKNGPFGYENLENLHKELQVSLPR